MTLTQSRQVAKMRKSGLEYAEIASRIGLSKGCVESYCTTHKFSGNGSFTHVVQEVGTDNCRTCGEPLQQTPGKRKKLFCCDACRMDWWNSHQHEVKRKAFYPHTCARCGKKFISYGKTKRVYCSHACFIAARFPKSGK